MVFNNVFFLFRHQFFSFDLFYNICLLCLNMLLLVLPIYHEGDDLWLALVLLHCFDIITIHCSNRVM
jgi:hypothetical protein